MPMDLGTHHCANSSGLVQASNTIRGGASKVRVTVTSRSDVRFTSCRAIDRDHPPLAIVHHCSPSRLSSSTTLSSSLEPGIPKLAIPLDPFRLLLEAAEAEPAGPHAPDLLRR